MGLAVWGLVLLGAICGHVVTVVNLAWVVGFTGDFQSLVDHIVGRAVKEVLRECSELESLAPTTTSSTTTYPFGTVGIEWFLPFRVRGSSSYFW